jgi:hypothetical protein
MDINPHGGRMDLREYRTNRDRLLSDLRGIRRMAKKARSMTTTALLVRQCWAKQRALLTLRAEQFGYAYDLSWVNSQLAQVNQ